MSLEQTLAELSRTWHEKGCQLLPPATAALPSGIFHPDIFFALLGSEPWSGACFQPVLRPLDARAGRHPFRFARQLQFEVIVKKPGADLRSAFQGSLEALGFDFTEHDLRFAEWTFEAHSLGASGLGWRVLLDGFDIAHFIHLQELAGRPLEPGAVEISYALERLLLARAPVSEAWELPLAKAGTTRGDLHRAAELEMSRFTLEAEENDRLEERLALDTAEARHALAAGLPRRAYELAVGQLVHLDVLGARGEMNERRRQGRLDEVRELVLAAAALHLAEAS